MNLILSLAGALLLGPVSAAKISFEGIDVYRSSSLTAEKVEEAALPLVRKYVRMRGIGNKGALKRADRLKGQIEERIRALSDFAHLDMHYGLYFTSSKRSVYITIDVVDRKDSKVRLPFRKKPNKFLKDPEKLLASWAKYRSMWDQISRRGTAMTERYRCPSFYCQWGEPSPEIEQMDRHFSQFVKPNWKALANISKYHMNASKREAAVYLAAYSKDGDNVSVLLGVALEDPAENVRSAALEIFSDISVYHSKVPLEIEKLVAALDYPSTGDRSKAMAVLVGKVYDSKYRPYILKYGTPHLLRILKLKQPSNHDLAYTLLGLLSRESYDRQDYKSWERWVDRQQRLKVKKKKR